MGIIRRLILLFYTLAVLAALVIAAGVCLRVIPTSVWQNELTALVAQPNAWAVIVIMAIGMGIEWIRKRAESFGAMIVKKGIR